LACGTTASGSRENAPPKHIEFRRSQLTQTKIQRALAVKFNTPPKIRLTGEPIMRILCNKTNTLVGYLYRWNNGDLQPAWLNIAVAEVRYEPMFEAA
jgi:hypothetical protein